MSTSKTITLKFPLTIKEGETEKRIDTLIFGRLKAKHLRLLPQAFFSEDEEERSKVTAVELIPIIAALADIPIEVADEIDLVMDFPAISKEVSDFLMESLETGKK